MKAKLVVSWIVLIFGGVVGARLSYAGEVGTDPLVSALGWGYLFWAIYWGIPVLFRWWSMIPVRDERRFWKLGFGCVFVPCLGTLYGLYGGGLYQCLKTWWLSRK